MMGKSSCQPNRFNTTTRFFPAFLKSTGLLFKMWTVSRPRPLTNLDWGGSWKIWWTTTQHMLFCENISHLTLAFYDAISRQVSQLFGLVDYVPDNPKQAYLDCWNIRRLMNFACRRQKDAARRQQTPRDSKLNFYIDHESCWLILSSMGSQLVIPFLFKFKLIGSWMDRSPSLLRMLVSEPSSIKLDSYEIHPRDLGQELPGRCLKQKSGKIWKKMRKSALMMGNVRWRLMILKKKWWRFPERKKG